MDEISNLLNEYSSIVLKDGKESDKCDFLSKSDLFNEYTDCWLLLSILSKKLDDSPFYSIRSRKIDKGYQILRIKFLVWLELIYQNSVKISEDEMNPIEFIRRSDYNNFFESYGKKFASWKAEAFRGLFDSDLSSNNQSFQNFKQNSQNLIDDSQFDQSEKEIYEALNGNKDIILKLLQNDPHNEMWAELFTSYLKESMVSTNFSIPNVVNFTALDFQKYCFKLDLFQRLHEDLIITENASKIDLDSLAFYFNLAIIFKNKKLADFLLNNYIKLLYQCERYDDIFDYTFFLKSKLFTLEESRNSISFVVSLFEPEESRSSFFLRALLKRKEDESENILLGIKNHIIANYQKDYLRYIEWAKRDLNNKKELLQLVVDSIQISLKYRQNISQSIKQKLDGKKFNNQKNTNELQNQQQEEQFINESFNNLVTDSAYEFFSWNEIIKNTQSRHHTFKKEIPAQLETATTISYFDIINEIKQKNQNEESTNINQTNFDEETLIESLSLLAIDFFKSNKKPYFTIYDIFDKLENDFWDSFLDIQGETESKNQKDYLRALKWLKLDKCVEDDFLQLAIDCTYELVMRNQFLLARETYDMIQGKFSDELEDDFWNSFLPLSNDDKDKKAISSFKQLLIWTASMKKNQKQYQEKHQKGEDNEETGLFPFGYETCENHEESSRKTNRLINHLFCYITNTYQRTFNNNILNENQE